MEINYHLTEDDYLNFNLYHVKNSKAAMRTLNIQRFLMPIFFIAAAYLFSTIDDVPFLWMLVPFIIVSILWFIFYPKYFYNHVARGTRKMIKEGKNEGLLGDHTMRLSDEGIVDSNSNGETKVNWSGIHEFKESSDTFYLYNSAISAYILPKRELANVAEVREYLSGKIKAN
ncbi:YcxB family protein [Neobacillus sp. NPDC093127]|uniref:YcxB family protein n=1 Tax=Neobacillus sp. NPDC093127 TaxID=3364296 RepID=UPI00382A4EC5